MTRKILNPKRISRILKILFYSLGGIILCFFSVILLLNAHSTQQWIAKQALDILNKDFKTKISTKEVYIDFFGDIKFLDLRAEDHKGTEFIKIRELKANSDWLKLAKNAITGKEEPLIFKSITLKKADVKVVTYKGDSISNFVRWINLFDDEKERDPQKPPFRMNMGVKIEDSRVSITNENSLGDSGKWLSADEFCLEVPSLSVVNAEVRAKVERFSFRTKRWGKKYRVNNFTGNFALTSEALSLDNLFLDTEASLLKGNLKLGLDKKTGWQDFGNKVNWELSFEKGNKISGYDIGYFIDNWDNFSTFNVSGAMYGSLNNFVLDHFALSNDKIKFQTDRIKFQNLVGKSLAVQTHQISANFSYMDLKKSLPSFISVKMKHLADNFGNIRLKGGFRLSPKKIKISQMQLVAGIGSATIHHFELENHSTNKPIYRGTLDIDKLNLSAITKSKDLGTVSGKIEIAGESFDPELIKLKIKADIKNIRIASKTLINTELKGIIEKKNFKGWVRLDDTEAKGEIKGVIDFSTKKLKGDTEVRLSFLNLDLVTGNTKSEQILSGNIEAKFSLSSIDDLVLEANLKNTTLTSPQQNISIKNASIKTLTRDREREIDIKIPELAEGKITGIYSIKNLGAIFQNGLHKILQEPEPKRKFVGQNFSLNFDVHQNLIAFFIPTLKTENGLHISGKYNGNTNDLIINGSLKKAVYLILKKTEEEEKQKNFNQEISSTQMPQIKTDPEMISDSIIAENIILKINTAYKKEKIFAKVEKAKTGENLIKSLIISGNEKEKNFLCLSVLFLYSGKNEAEGNETKYKISVDQTTSQNGDYVFLIKPTTLMFNKVAWSITKEPEIPSFITYVKKDKSILVKNILFLSDKSRLKIKEVEYTSAKKFFADVEIDNLEIGKIFEMQPLKNTLNIEGKASGTLMLRISENNVIPLIELKIDDIVMEKKKMGNISFVTTNSEKPNVYDLDLSIYSSNLLQHKNLEISGIIDNSEKAPLVDLKAKMNDMDIGIAQNFISTVFSRLRGKASGEIALTGPLNDIDYNGNINLSGLGLRINFTGVDYQFKDVSIPISKGFAELNNLEIKDLRDYSNGTLAGFIRFESLSSLGVNLIIRANNLMVLDSYQRDNDLFWGRIFSKGDLFISGPVTQLDISTPNMKVLSNSVFTFNSNSTSNVDEFKMLRFVTKNQSGEFTVEKRIQYGANMNIDFNLDVDKSTSVNVLVGDDFGDISVRGTSKGLRFKMSKNGTINLEGSYFVDNGSFVSKAILERKFQINKESNLVWNGNPMTPRLDIKANYQRTVTNAGQYLGTGSIPPINVVLTTKITGTLDNPKITLDVSAPSVSSQLKEILKAKMSNEDEKIIQFGSILTMSSFNVANTGGYAINVGSTLESSGYNMLFKQLGSVLNNISNQFQVDLNYLKGDNSENINDRANASVNIAVSPRVKIKTGLGVPISKANNATNSYLTGEGIIEYDWSKKNDGSRLLQVYSKPSNIGLLMGGGASGYNQTYGIGIVYHKNFNAFFQQTQHTFYDKKDSVKTDTLN
ncbi:MAG: translocation/assembly module TamB [Bergeyella sp.]|nr:translocation/assembly module TamB [Bergeyella sp.]